MQADISSHSLTDLVPAETLERVRWLFTETVGVPLVFTDAAGNPVTPVDDRLGFCATLVRGEAGGALCLRRARWDVPEPEVEDAIRQQHRGTRPLAHRCMGGFRDAAVPIVVEDHVIGYAVFARTLVDAPDIAGFRKMAQAAGMDPQVGEEVARHAVVMAPERVEQVAEFLQVITSLVASAAYDTLRARQVLELEKLRDDLVHMIVHDLRTPLTAIMGGLQTVVEADFEQPLTREFVGLALSSAETLLEMVNALLDIHKMESGEMTLNLEPLDFGAIARAAADQVRGLAHERGQELVLDIAPDCSEGVYADGEKLRRVCVNLLGNAVKFTQDGGRIELSACCEDEGLLFCVQDNGPGIPPEYQERIFEKFGQVEQRNAGQRHSTGLGLTFCKMVAEAHGGRIWVDSEPGKGSRFCVFIPGGVPKPQTAEPAQRAELQ